MERVKYSFAHKLVLSESQLRNVSLDDKKQFYSETLSADNIPGLTYYFDIYPRKDETSAFLYVKYDKSVYAKLSIEVESTGYMNKMSTEFMKNSQLGQGLCLCSFEDLMNPQNKWIVDGKLTVKFTGTLSAKVSVTKPFFNSVSFLSCLWFRNDKDFTILVDGREIKVHKFVFANASRVFDRMLQTQWRETESQMTITDFDTAVIGTAVFRFYDGPIAPSLETAMGLLRFADKFDIPVIKEEMETYLMEKISMSAVVKLANASFIANAVKLNQRCLEFLAKGNKAYTIPDIKELDADMKDQLLEKAFTFENELIFRFYNQSSAHCFQKCRDFLVFTDNYNISVLKSAVETYLIEKISNSSVVKLANTSVMANAENLNLRCLEFLIKSNKSSTIPDIKELDPCMKDKLLDEAYTTVVNCKD